MYWGDQGDPSVAGLCKGSLQTSAHSLSSDNYGCDTLDYSEDEAPTVQGEAVGCWQDLIQVMFHLSHPYIQ